METRYRYLRDAAKLIKILMAIFQKVLLVVYAIMALFAVVMIIGAYSSGGILAAFGVLVVSSAVGAICYIVYKYNELILGVIHDRLLATADMADNSFK